MDVIVTQLDGVTIAEPRGRLDTAGARPFADQLTARVQAGAEKLVIDFAHVRYVSSSGFRALLILARLIEERQGRLVLCGLSPDVTRLFDIGQFTGVFTILATRADAIQALA